MPTPLELSVEFTAAQTVAVITRADGGTEPLSLDGSPQLPVPPPGGAGALLGRILAAATTALGERPQTVTLIHPDDWDPTRVRELVDAAGHAGLPAPAVLPRRAEAPGPAADPASPPVAQPQPLVALPPPPAVGPPVPVAAARSGRVGLIVVAAVVALLVGLGIGAAVGYGLGAGRESPGSGPGTDQAAVKAAKTGIEAMFTYDYQNVDATLDEATPHMTASFAKEFKASMKKLRPHVEKEEATMSTEVINSGAAEAKDGTVEVLLFADQVITNKNITGERVDRSRVVANMVSGEDGWKIDDVTVN